MLIVNTYQSFLCGIALAAVVATTVDGSCVGGWQSNFGYEYCVESTEETQATARSICHSRDAELASITSDAECDYVAGLIDSTSWIGLYKNSSSSTNPSPSHQYWLDGSTSTFRRWQAGEPDRTNTYCIRMRTNGEFEDANCGGDLEFVCKRPEEYTTTDATTTTTVPHTTTTAQATTTTIVPTTSTFEATTTTSVPTTTLEQTTTTLFTTTPEETTTTDLPSTTKAVTTTSDKEIIIAGAAATTTTEQIAAAAELTTTTVRKTTTTDTTTNAEITATTAEPPTLTTTTTTTTTPIQTETPSMTTNVSATTTSVTTTTNAATSTTHGMSSALPTTTTVASAAATNERTTKVIDTNAPGTTNPTSAKTVPTTMISVTRITKEDNTTATQVPAMIPVGQSSQCPDPATSNAELHATWGVSHVIAIYICPTGRYFPQGGTRRTLLCTNDSWLNDAPTCTVTRCRKNLSLRKNRLTNADDFVELSQTSVSSCDNGQRFDDGTHQENIKCTTARQRVALWSQPESACDGRCGPPPLVENAAARLHQPSRSVTFTCLIGHRFPDGLTVKTFYCHADGSWDYNIPHCDVVYCPKLPVPSHAELSTEQTVYNTLVTVTCNIGFKHADGRKSKNVLCLDNTIWNDTDVECQVTERLSCVDAKHVAAIRCNGIELPNFINAQSVTSHAGVFPYAHDVIYTCADAGYRFEDGNTFTTVSCSSTGWTWNVFLKSCGPNRCAPVPVVQHAVSDGYSAVQGSVIRYTCIDGFLPATSSPLPVECDGVKWIPSGPPRCEVVHCAPLETTYSKLNSTDTEFGVTVNISCLPGYRINAQTTATVHCTSTGYWSLNDTCLPLDCGPPVGIDNAVLTSSTSTLYNSSVTFQCVAGYWFYRGVYSISSTCRADGLWTTINVHACKLIRCPAFVFRVVSSTRTSVGSLVNVSCPAGQKLQTGHSVMRTLCSQSGDWTPPVPECVDDEQFRAATKVIEAEGAEYIGYVILVVIAVPIGVIIILDVLNLVKMYRLQQGVLISKHRLGTRKTRRTKPL